MRYKHYLQKLYSIVMAKMYPSYDTRVKCIGMDTNQAYGTNGTIDIHDTGLSKYALNARAIYLTVDPFNCLWKICYEQNNLWLMVF